MHYSSGKSKIQNIYENIRCYSIIGEQTNRENVLHCMYMCVSLCAGRYESYFGFVLLWSIDLRKEVAREKVHDLHNENTLTNDSTEIEKKRGQIERNRYIDRKKTC